MRAHQALVKKWLCSRFAMNYRRLISHLPSISRPGLKDSLNHRDIHGVYCFPSKADNKSLFSSAELL
jgi:hypothetical protein